MGGPFPFEAQVEPSAPKKVFADKQDLEAWLKAERQFWQPYRDASDVIPELPGRISALDQISALMVGRTIDDVQAPTMVQRVEAATKPRPTARQRAFLDGLPVEQRPAALAVLHGLRLDVAQVLRSHQSLTPVLAGAGRAVLFQDCADPGRSAEVWHSLEARVEELLGSAARKLDELRKGAESFREQSEAALQGADASLLKLRDEHNVALIKTLDEATNARATADSQLEEFKRKTQEEIALRAPCTYWDDRCAHHRTYARAWLATALVLLVGGPLAFHWLVVGAFAGSLTTSLTWPPDARALLVLAVVTVLIWLVRLAVRTYTSHFHLAADAAERKVLIETYLALREANAFPDEGSALSAMLAAVFRHVPSGVVKEDDASPGTPTDLITRVFQK